jgi:hypothetical protein
MLTPSYTRVRVLKAITCHGAMDLSSHVKFIIASIINHIIKLILFKNHAFSREPLLRQNRIYLLSGRNN